MTDFSIIGKSIAMIDAAGKTTGAGKYADDFTLPGMLVGKILHSPYPHARIKSIDTSRAKALDGVAMLACTMLAASYQDCEITTVEGISDGGGLAALQKAYGDFGGSQCGYCTPGFMMTVRGLLASNPDPTEQEIREALSSNLCRCTGYAQMYEAIRAVIEAERADRQKEAVGQ